MMGDNMQSARDGESVPVSGNCPECSWRDRLVFHDTPWCPRSFATAWMDTNMGDPAEDGRYVRWVRPNRPVKTGELVLAVDTGDGQDWPLATWVRMLSDAEAGKGADAIECAEVGISNGFLYVEGAFSRPVANGSTHANGDA